MLCLCDHAPNTLKKHFSHDENISQELNIISPYVELSQTHRHRQTYRQTDRETDRHTHTHTHTHSLSLIYTYTHTHTHTSDLSPVTKQNKIGTGTRMSWMGS